MDEINIQDLWELACQTTRARAERTARSGDIRFGALMLEVAQRYGSQSPPTTKEELSFRQMQSMSVIMMIGHIAYAEMRAKLNPKASDALYQYAKTLANEPLPANKDECGRFGTKLVEAASDVSQICRQHR